MALLAYALTTVAKLRSYMGSAVASEELFSIYHDGTGGVTTTSVTGFAGQLNLTTNVGATAFLYSANATIADLVTNINASTGNGSEGFVAAVLGASGVADASGIDIKAHEVGNGLLIANQAFVTGVNEAFLQDAINAATEEIEALTSRRFISTTYNQLFNGSGRRRINLRHFPLIDVERVAVGRRAAFRVVNESTDAAHADVSIDGSNLTLDITGGANDGSDTVAYTTTTTLAAFLVSINAIGKAWTGTLESDADGSWLVDDLFQFEGRNALRTELSVSMAEQSLRSYDIDAAIGQLVRTNVGRSAALLGPQFLRTGGHAFTPWELRPITAESAGPFWPEGVLNVYVKYTAGYATIPADIEMIANRVAAAHVRMRKRDPTMQSESVSGYSYTRATDDAPLTDAIKGQLQKYKRIWAGPVADV